MTEHTRQYSLNHHLVNKVRGPAKLQVCALCGRSAYDWATITGLDSEKDALDPHTGFIPLCRSCHRTYDGFVPNWKGRRHTPEAIEKIRQAKLGRPVHTPESRQKISEAMRGRTFSPETRKRMRQAQQRRPKATPEEKARRLAAQHGTPTGYRRGCRCEPCKAAQAAYKKAAYWASKETQR